MFKIKFLFALIFFITTYELFSVVGRIDKGIMAKIETDLKCFHEETYSSGTPKPSIKEFEGKGCKLFVAKMDSFGFDRWFSFETDEDITELVQAIRQGDGMSLSLYYLENPFMYDLIDIKELSFK